MARRKAVRAHPRDRLSGRLGERAAPPRPHATRADLYFDDGSMLSLGEGSPEADRRAAARARAAGRRRPGSVSSAALGRLIAERAPAARATSCCARASAPTSTSTSTASRPTRAAGPIGEALAAAAREHEPDGGAAGRAGARRGAAGDRGGARERHAVPDRALAAKAYGTERRIEGVYEPGERVLLVEDVVTAGGAALEAVRALRAAGLVVERALCVLDREEGGAEALAAEGVELPLACSCARPTLGHGRARNRP